MMNVNLGVAHFHLLWIDWTGANERLHWTGHFGRRNEAEWPHHRLGLIFATRHPPGFESGCGFLQRRSHLL